MAMYLRVQADTARPALSACSRVASMRMVPVPRQRQLVVSHSTEKQGTFHPPEAKEPKPQSQETESSKTSAKYDPEEEAKQWPKSGSQAKEATDGNVITAQQKGQGIQKKVDNASEAAGALYKEDQRCQPEKAEAAMRAATGTTGIEP